MFDNDNNTVFASAIDSPRVIATDDLVSIREPMGTARVSFRISGGKVILAAHDERNETVVAIILSPRMMRSIARRLLQMLARM